MAHTPKPLRQKGRRIFNHFKNEERKHPDWEPDRKVHPLKKRMDRFARSAASASSLEGWDERDLVKIGRRRWRRGH